MRIAAALSPIDAPTCGSKRARASRSWKSIDAFPRALASVRPASPPPTMMTFMTILLASMFVFLVKNV